MDTWENDFDGESWKGDKPGYVKSKNIFVVEASDGEHDFLIPRVIWKQILRIARKYGWQGKLEECGCGIEGCRCCSLMGENLKEFAEACEKGLQADDLLLSDEWIKSIGEYEHIDEEQEAYWALTIDARKKEYLKEFISFCQSGEIVVFGCDQGRMNLPVE